MGRPFLLEIAVLDHLLDIIRHVGAQIVTAVGQFADRELLLADVRQDQSLDIVDIGDARSVELHLHDPEKLPMQPLDEPNCPEICLFHRFFPLEQAVLRCWFDVTVHRRR